MNRRFPEFDRSRLKLEPLDRRTHNLDLSSILPLEPTAQVRPELAAVAKAIGAARANGAAAVLMMGAHVIRSGVQKHLIDLMERGLLSCIAVNGASVIHDFEFALIGATTESVERYIEEGQFGLWRETGRLNDIVAAAASEGAGLGEAVGRAIEEENLPHRDISVLAAAHRLGIPVTVHIGIGYDIVHEHPNFDGAAYGAASYTDFLRFAAALENLEGGVIMNFGSSIMAPEVYLKALAMARNVAKQEGRKIANFTSLVCDLKNLAGPHDRAPSTADPDYYFRPWKTMLARTISDGGESMYVQGRHAETIPELWTAIASEEMDQKGGAN